MEYILDRLLGTNINAIIVCRNLKFKAHSEAWLKDKRIGREGLVAQQNGWKVSCAPVKHAGGVCYRIDSGGKSLLYSGDTCACHGLIKLGREVDLAVMECSYPNPASLKGEHLYPTLAGASRPK